MTTHPDDPEFLAFVRAAKAVDGDGATLQDFEDWQSDLETPLMNYGLRLPAFTQRNPKFAEGSMPTLFDEEGNLTDEGRNADGIAKLMWGLDPRTTFKLGMDGFGQLATGLVWLDTDNDYAHMLAVKGDIYNKGKVGVIGGVASDRDRGNPMRTMLREQGEEVGAFAFDATRLFELLVTNEWRETDSRGPYAIRSSFYAYLATGAETRALQAGYAHHVATTGGDPEIQGIRPFARREVLEHIRDGRMGYFDQTQAFVMANLIIGLLPDMQAYMPGHYWSALLPSQQWQMTKALAQRVFDDVTDMTDGDWRPKLDPDYGNFGLTT